MLDEAGRIVTNGNSGLWHVLPIHPEQAEMVARVLGRAALLRDLWGRRGGATRTLDVHVRRLRAKLGTAAVIETVRGVGYRLVVPGATAPPDPE